MMNSTSFNMFLAILLYLPTCAFIPVEFYLLVFLISAFLCREQLKIFVQGLLKKKSTDRNLFFLILIAILAMGLRLIDYSNWTGLKDFYSYAYLFPMTYIIALSLKERKVVFKFLAFILALEVLVAVAEYIAGVSTFFTVLRGHREIEHYNLLYFARVFGLSYNSSALSLKLLAMIILLPKIEINPRLKLALELLFVAGSIITFGRITLIILAAYYIVKLVLDIYHSKNTEAGFQGFHFKIIPMLSLFLFFGVNPSWTANQFTRGGMTVTDDRLEDDYDDAFTKALGLDGVEMSGRNEIWNAYFEFFVSNPVIGNNGKKYMIGKYHAHNSFLQLLASYGSVITALIVLLILMNLSKENWLIVGLFCLIGLGQYFIFWGISFFDILFYYFLFIYKKQIK